MEVFFILNAKIFKFIKNDYTMLEKEPLEKLQKEGNYTLLNIENFGSAWIPCEIKTI